LIIINIIVERFQSATLRLSNVLLMRRVPGPLAGEPHHSIPVGLAYPAEDVLVLILHPGSLPGLLEKAMDVGNAASVTSLPSRGLDHGEDGV